jgi:hypothetical protein
MLGEMYPAKPLNRDLERGAKQDLGLDVGC